MQRNSRRTDAAGAKQSHSSFFVVKLNEKNVLTNQHVAHCKHS